jgi:hypothetical protein
MDHTSSDNTTPHQAYADAFHKRNIKPEEGPPVNRSRREAIPKSKGQISNIKRRDNAEPQSSVAEGITS